MVTILIPQTKQSAPLAAPCGCEIWEMELESIPMIGWVSCGKPIEIYSAEDTISVPTALVKRNTYALRVRGDSMKDANIVDGDIVVIEQSQVAENGERVVVRINQKEVTLKTLRLNKDGIELMPANESLEPIVLTNDDVEVLGIVSGVIRDQV